MEPHFTKIDLPESGVLVFPIAEDLKLSAELQKLDKVANGAVKKALKAVDFTGKQGKCLTLIGLDEHYSRIVVIGVGAAKGDDAIEDETDIEVLGAKLAAHLDKERIEEAIVIIENTIGGFAQDFVAAHMAYGARLKQYRFDKYFTKQKEEDKPALHDLTFMLASATPAKTKYEKLSAIAEGVYLTRDIVSEPPNVLHPESYADICRKLKEIGLKIEVLGEKELRKLGMNALLGVGQGSVLESNVVIMQWNGAPKRASQKPVAFVGKGVTFDTGGISLKPSKSMDEMKYDMAGSGTVVGLMKALALRKARVNAIGVIGLVENMPGGEAQRPGDIVKSLSGQTIEVLNTDAEGRLVLADVLWYTQDRFQPRFMVDLATLTGAIVVGLGLHKAGLFSNNDELSERLYEAGEQVGEHLWRLPLGEKYDKQIDSKVADVQNISNMEGGGSITAAQFLQRFVNDVPWAHLDIAGMAWTKKNLDLVPEGASGFGVRLLDRLVANHYER